MRARATVTLVALLGAAASTLAATSAGRPAGSPRPGPDPAASPAVSRIGGELLGRPGTADVLARLDELAAGLARLEARGCERRRPDAEAGGEVPDEQHAELASLARGIEALEAEVAGLRRAVSRTALPAQVSLSELALLRETRPETDWHALERVADAWRRDRNEAHASLRFLTPADLLERFGPPTRVSGGEDGEVRWSWAATADDAPGPYRVHVSLHDGYVTDAGVVHPSSFPN